MIEPEETMNPDSALSSNTSSQTSDNFRGFDSDDSEEDSPSLEFKGLRSAPEGLMSERQELQASLKAIEKQIAEEQDLIKEYEQLTNRFHEDWLLTEKQIEVQRKIRQDSRKEIRELEENKKTLEDFLMEPSDSDDLKAVLDEIEMITQQLLEMDKLNLELENKIRKQEDESESGQFQLAETVSLSSHESNVFINQAEPSVCLPQQNASTLTEFDVPATDTTSYEIKDSFSVAPEKILFTIGAAPGGATNKKMTNKTSPPTSNPDAPSQLLETLNVNQPQQFSFGQTAEEEVTEVSSQAETSSSSPQEKPPKILFTIGAAPGKVTQRRRKR